MNADTVIKRWPKKKHEQYEVLLYLQSKFEKDRKYSEKEINDILKKWHSFNDYALLRRELYNNYLLNRTPDCREYWLSDD